MKYNLILLIMFAITIVLNSQDLSTDNNNEFTQNNNLSSSDKLKTNSIKNNLKINLSCNFRDSFEYYFIKNSILNKNNLFDLDTYSNIYYIDTRVKLSLYNIFHIYYENSFRYILSGNQLYNLKDKNHSDNFEKYCDNLVKECYFLWNIPIDYAIKINFGRVFFNYEKSYIFNIFGYMRYKETTLNNILDYDEVGINMLKYSMYFPICSFNIIYSPGLYKENDITELFNIQSEQKFLGQINFRFPSVEFGFNAYLDTNLKWAIGSSFSVDANSELIIFFDYALVSNTKYYRLIKCDEVIYGKMNKYKWEEKERLVFRGEIGINWTPNSMFNIINEIYFNSNGMTMSEINSFFTNINNIQDNYENNKLLRKYYYGIKGDSLSKINDDIFKYEMLLLLTRISNDNIYSTGIGLSLLVIVSFLDGSTMFIPEIQYSFLDYFLIKFNANIFLSSDKSIFNEMVHQAILKLIFEIKI